MNDRRVDVFFYGLFTDRDILREGGVAPINPRRAHVEEFALRIGQRATLVPTAGARAYPVGADPKRPMGRNLYASSGRCRRTSLAP